MQWLRLPRRMLISRLTTLTMGSPWLRHIRVSVCGRLRPRCESQKTCLCHLEPTVGSIRSSSAIIERDLINREFLASISLTCDDWILEASDLVICEGILLALVLYYSLALWARDRQGRQQSDWDYLTMQWGSWQEEVFWRVASIFILRSRQRIQN